MSLEQFLDGFEQGPELERLKQIPDVQQYFLTKQTHNQNNQRRFLYMSSLLIVLATTLFYVGYSKQVFSDKQYQYESDGILKNDEPINAISRWERLLTPEEKKDPNLAYQKKLVMAKRVNQKSLAFFEYQGPYFRTYTPNGYRHYQLMKEKVVIRPINAWLQVFGVLLFSAGIMGFVLERRLFKSGL